MLFSRGFVYHNDHECIAFVSGATCATRLLGGIVINVGMEHRAWRLQDGRWSGSRLGSVLPGPHDGDFFGCFGGCAGVAAAADDDEEDEATVMPSVNGEYGAATEWGGARCPAFVRGGSAEPGHFFCSSCILSSGSPTTWYLAQLMGGHRTTFCGCGMGGKLGASGFGSMWVESLRESALLSCSS